MLIKILWSFRKFSLIAQISFLSDTFGPIKNSTDFVVDNLKNVIGFKFGGIFYGSSFDTSGPKLAHQTRFSERSKNFDQQVSYDF